MVCHFTIMRQELQEQDERCLQVDARHYKATRATDNGDELYNYFSRCCAYPPAANIGNSERRALEFTLP